MDNLIIGRLFGFDFALVSFALVFAVFFFVIFSLVKKRRTLFVWLLPLLIIVFCCEALYKYFPRSRSVEIYCFLAEAIAVSVLAGLIPALLFGQRLARSFRKEAQDGVRVPPMECFGIKFTFRQLSSKKEKYEVYKIRERIASDSSPKNISADEFLKAAAEGGAMLYRINPAGGQPADMCVYALDNAEGNFDLSVFSGKSPKSRNGSKDENAREVSFLYEQRLCGGMEGTPENGGLEEHFMYFYPFVSLGRSFLIVLDSNYTVRGCACTANGETAAAQEECRRMFCTVLGELEK